MALYHFAYAVACTNNIQVLVAVASTELLPVHSWGSCVFGNKLYPSLLIAFLEVLPHLSLIISYLMTDLVETQCCAVRNGTQCTISTPTLLLHMNEPKFKALL